MRIHCLQNDPLVDPGFIADWASKKNYPLSVTRVYANDPFPTIESFDLLIILGGSMGAYEEERHPWLAKEKAFIRETIAQNAFVLGICLGIQLMAEALGGRAYRHAHKEIGWWPVQLAEEARHEPLLQDLPEAFPIFQWHGDTFDLPPGAVPLATSSACANQAFRYGERALGIQFHPESTGSGISLWVEKFAADLKPGGYIQSAADMMAQTAKLEQGKSVMYTLLDNFERSFQEQHAVKQ
ncbi:UNVERIFIED_CONTAM: GMP synthase-like glutamine amidotransferase [Brevibacillus sp. OAP136]